MKDKNESSNGNPAEDSRRKEAEGRPVAQPFNMMDYREKRTPAPAPTGSASGNNDVAKGKPGEAASVPAKPGEAGSEPGKDDTKKEPLYRFEPEPDAPLRPHRTHSRAELLIASPRVLMTPEAYKRMCLYIEIAPKEVGWLGTVSKTQRGDFLIEEVFLVEQEVTSVETELNVEGREKLVLELLKDGDPGLDKANKLHFWGHSHVRMSTGPSGTDERTMEQFGEEGHAFYIRGIFTKLGRGEFTVYLYDKGFRVIDAPWAVWDPKEGVILEPNRFPAYSFGGGSAQDSSSGFGSIFGPSREAMVLRKDKPLPPQLVPDAALRAAVMAEYEEKVTERKPIFRWFRKDKDEEAPVMEVEDGDCYPTGIFSPDAPAQYTGRPVPPPTGRQIYVTGTKPADSGGGFWDWFFGLFSGTPSQPAAPSNQSAPPAPPTRAEDKKPGVAPGEKQDPASSSQPSDKPAK